MSLTAEDVRRSLRSVKHPQFTRDVVSFGFVRDVRVEGGIVEIWMQLGAGNPADTDQIERECREAVGALPGVSSVSIHLTPPPATSGPHMAGVHTSAAAPSGALDSALIREVKHPIAVASGKGGVGKSTVAVNLAIALARCGARVGILDADIYGPSIPLMMGVDEQPRLDAGTGQIIPFERYGVCFMSLGFLVPKDTAVVWRGPMVMKAVTQLLGDVSWGELDVLVIDMPPGTGDAQLTLSQKVRLAGAVIVTTPQDVALADAIKGVVMFRKVNVPILGIIENMSFFACPHCGSQTDIFGHGGGGREAERLGVPFLGEIGLAPAVREGGDTGKPIVAAAPNSREAQVFGQMASYLLRTLEGESRSPAPKAVGGGMLDWLRRGSSGKRD